MTPEQREQFYQYGCVSRCIIQLSEWHKKPITADDFITRFLPDYPQWSKFCGLLSVSDIIDLCRELKIGRHANTYRDFAVVRDYFRDVKTSGVFMFSERNLAGGNAPLYHCSLIGYENNRFRIWSPVNDGTFADWEVEFERLYDLADKLLAHFLVLRCDR